jgi:hypothetical protein
MFFYPLCPSPFCLGCFRRFYGVDSVFYDYFFPGLGRLVGGDYTVYPYGEVFVKIFGVDRYFRLSRPCRGVRILGLRQPGL